MKQIRYVITTQWKKLQVCHVEFSVHEVYDNSVFLLSLQLYKQECKLMVTLTYEIASS